MPGARDVPLLEWVGRIGAAGAEDLARRFGISVHSVRARLGVLRRAGLVEERRLLAGVAPLYVATRAGLRRCGLTGLDPCRVSAASFAHWQACARVAVFLERRHPGRIGSDRELRLVEREQGAAVVSARLGLLATGEPGRHHPDLVVWPARPGDLPVAVEVELTVKAAGRLAEICRAWARSRDVAGVAYYASAPVIPALDRAIATLEAAELLSVTPLAVVDAELGPPPSPDRTG